MEYVFPVKSPTYSSETISTVPERTLRSQVGAHGVHNVLVFSTENVLAYNGAADEV